MIFFGKKIYWRKEIQGGYKLLFRIFLKHGNDQAILFYYIDYSKNVFKLNIIIGILGHMCNIGLKTPKFR